MYILDRSLSHSHCGQQRACSCSPAGLQGFSEPDPEALKAQRELMERRDALMRQRDELKSREERENRARNIESLDPGLMSKPLKRSRASCNCRPERASSKEAHDDSDWRRPSIPFLSPAPMSF
jgi:hypothetical protein